MKSKKLRGEYVLIEPDTQEEVTSSGITLAKKPDQGDFSTGVIKEVGTGKRVDGLEGYDRPSGQPTFNPIDLSVGDKVLFRYGLKVKINDTFLVLVNEADIILILEN